MTGRAIAGAGAPAGAASPRGADASFRNTRWRPSLPALGAVWLVELFAWLLLLLRSVATGQLPGVVLPAVLGVLGVVVAEIGFAGSVVLLGGLFGPVEASVGPTGLRLRYDTPTGAGERVVPWDAVTRIEWSTLAVGDVRVVGYTTSGRFQLDARSTLPDSLRRFLPPEAVIEVDVASHP